MGLWWSMMVYGFIALQRSEHPWVSPRPRPRRPNGRADGSRYLDSEGIQISTSWAWLQIWKPHGILIVIIVYGFEMLTNINEHQWNSMNITLSLQFHWPYPGKKTSSSWRHDMVLDWHRCWASNWDLPRSSNNPPAPVVRMDFPGHGLRVMM